MTTPPPMTMPSTFTAPLHEPIELPARSSLMGNYAPAAVHFVRGSGTELFDDTGRRYLDLLSGIAVTSLGHAHPVVAGAIADQAQRLLHVSNLYRNGLAEDVARRLDVLVGDGAEAGGKVFFANSGAEANECALKLARRYAGRGRHVVLCAYGSFHGRTLATLAATGQPHKHEPFEPMPEGFRHVPFDDVAELARAVDPDTVGAVLLEPVQGEGGIVVPRRGYLAEVRRLCDERGLLMIVDEIQTGLGRTGRWFGFQHEGVLPDVVTMAKALGNGMPIGTCWAREEVAEAFRPGDHGSTFGGQPLACAAARATLQVMVAEDVPARAREGGRRLSAGLGAIGAVVEVRGLGLLLGAVLAPGIVAGDVAAAALEAGLLVNALGDSVIRFAPPLLISEDEVDEALGIFAEVMEPFAKGLG
jgi:acetylornithine/N-succinyldiaminopimelate aminotransferase